MTGVLEAVTSAIGDELTRLAGFRFTRLTANVAAGVAVFPVETTFGWGSVGEVIVDGARYRYGGKTATSLTGVTYVDPGEAVGPAAAVNDTVTIPPAIGPHLLEIRVSGTFVGTITFEQTPDGGATWVAASLVDQDTLAVVGSTTTPGRFRGTFSQQIRARMTAWTSGAANVVVTTICGVGARQLHRVTAEVLDFSRVFSGVDSVRGQLFVSTAEGPYLSVVGRNLGVRRPVGLVDDAAFRRVVEALAYQPRGTMWGLELAFDAFFGRANYELYENRAAFPNTVFVKLADALVVATSPIGQTYLMVRETRPYLTGPQMVVVSGTPLAVQGIRMADEGRLDLLGTGLPGALMETRYLGDAGYPVWIFQGPSEPGAVTVAPATGATILNPGSLGDYRRHLRIRPESTASLSVTLTINTLMSAVEGRQVMLALRDGARDAMVGCLLNGGNVDAGFIDSGTGALLAGVATTFPLGTATTLEIRKQPGWWEFRRDGVVMQLLADAALPVSAVMEARWGCGDLAPGNSVTVRSVAFHATTPLDLWNTGGTSGATVVGQPGQLDTNSGVMVGGYAGLAIRTRSALTTPGSGAQNNGVWQVAAVVDPDILALTGPLRRGAYMSAAFPSRVQILTDSRAFRYPDDVGKRVQILAGPNAGIYVVADLRRDDNSVIAGPGVEECRACTVVTPPPGGFSTDTNRDWRLLPNFFTPDGAVTWELAGTGTLAGSNLTLAQAPGFIIPSSPYQLIVEPIYSSVQSGQVMNGVEVQNLIPTAGQTWYPFYLPQHPLGPYAIYLDDLTVAGVIPELKVGSPPGVNYA